ncbi:MAG: response regulator transcription factor [Chloroflexi bacterium]|nr:response regulator transcription factor [Chloroflexota bacterium]
MMKVVIIEDDPNIVEAVGLCFDLRWPSVVTLAATDGRKGLDLVRKEHPSIVIVDLGLPDRDGLDIVREIRSGSTVPIIILTARDDEMDKVRGLEFGADDYITKPFSHIEFLARVKAVLRRSEPVQIAEVTEGLTMGDLSINFRNREVQVKGQPVVLTPIEFRLLAYLVQNAGNVLNHRAILSTIWGNEYEDAHDYLKVYIQRLRSKLEENPEKPALILTERGIGYRFQKPPVRSQ